MVVGPGTSWCQATLTEPPGLFASSTSRPVCNSTTPPTPQATHTSMALANPPRSKRSHSVMESMTESPTSMPKTKTPSPPSLKTLAFNEAFKQILDPEFTDSKFASLPPHLRKLLFDKLRDGARRWKRAVANCPPVDLANFLSESPFVIDRNCPPGIPIMGWEVLKAGNQRYGGLGLVYDDYVLSHVSRYFRNIWSYKLGRGAHIRPHRDDLSGRFKDGRGQVVPVMNWDMESLYFDPQEEMVKCCITDNYWCQCGRNHTPVVQISSYLLLYRLVATFGMPPSNFMPEERTCWEVMLKFRGDVSEASVWDGRAQGNFSFIGSPTASEEFLKLINHLCGYYRKEFYEAILTKAEA